jgi:SAM-dependent methyltransferase
MNWKRWYEHQVSLHGNNQKGMGWRKKADWAMTYRIASSLTPSSVLDVGCGVGLGRTFFPPRSKYYGCDVVKESVRHAGDNCWVGDTYSTRGTYDIAVLSGIFNVGYSWTGVCEVLSDVESKVERGIVVSFALGPCADPFTTFPARAWGELLGDIGETTIRGPHGCSYTATTLKE